MYIKQVHGKFIETDGVKRENELDVLEIYCKKKKIAKVFLFLTWENAIFSAMV